MKKKMKKMMKQWCALMVTAALVLAAAPALAAAPTGKITLHVGDQKVEAVTFKAYRLMDATVSGGQVGYSINSDFAVFFDQYAKPNTDQSKDSAAYDYLKNNIKTLQSNLDQYITSQKVQPTKEATGNTATKDVTFDGLPYGYYAIIPTGTIGGTQTLSSSFVTLSSGTAVANLKGLKPGADKKVVEGEGSKEWGDAAIGQTVNFEVTSMVPDMTGFDKYTFKLVDIMSRGLTVDEATLKPTVKIGTKTLKDKTDFTAQITPNSPSQGETTITIEITNFINYKQYADETIIFTYNAVLNDQAVSTTAETNTAKVQYGNQPGTLESSKEDTVNVRTYDLTIKKRADNTNGALLGGAEFKLYKEEDAAKTNPIKLIDLKNGSYRVAKEGESNTVDTVVTPSADPQKGMITIKGLDQGKYILEEIKAPDGYNKLKDDVKVTITATSGDKGTTVTAEGLEQNVVNKAGTLLPGTGGMGTLLFTLVGAAGVVVILYSFIASKKRKDGETE